MFSYDLCLVLVNVFCITGKKAYELSFITRSDLFSDFRFFYLGTFLESGHENIVWDSVLCL